MTGLVVQGHSYELVTWLPPASRFSPPVWRRSRGPCAGCWCTASTRTSDRSGRRTPAGTCARGRSSGSGLWWARSARGSSASPVHYEASGESRRTMPCTPNTSSRPLWARGSGHRAPPNLAAFSMPLCSVCAHAPTQRTLRSVRSWWTLARWSWGLLGGAAPRLRPAWCSCRERDEGWRSAGILGSCRCHFSSLRCPSNLRCRPCSNCGRMGWSRGQRADPNRRGS